MQRGCRNVDCSRMREKAGRSVSEEAFEAVRGFGWGIGAVRMERRNRFKRQFKKKCMRIEYLIKW